MNQPHPLVTIAVCTYKRPEGIAKCLRSLLEQKTTFPYDIVVVENDPAQGSRAAIEAFQAEAASKNLEIHYACEPKPNISIARNRCVAEAKGEFLAFLDDDEWAEPDWCEKLVEVQKQTQADIVWGAVLPLYGDDYPPYLLDILDHSAHLTEGQRMTMAATNTTLFCRRILKFREGPFDLAFGRTGGEDSELTLFLSQRNGAVIVKTFLAKVYETIPASRSSMWYYWKRACRESFLSTKIIQTFYGRAAGSKTNFKYFGGYLRRFLKHLCGLPLQPRRTIALLGIKLAQMIGIVWYYSGLRIFSH